jgi:hypothetical protein
METKRVHRKSDMRTLMFHPKKSVKTEDLESEPISRKQEWFLQPLIDREHKEFLMRKTKTY